MHALLTDRYELATLGKYLHAGIAERRGVFELSVPRLPPRRRFLLVAGVDRIVRHLRDLRFTDNDVEYLRRAPGLADLMSDAMVHYLREFRFRGDLDVVPEGEVAFEAEPLVRIDGTLAEGQLLGTFLLGVINAETRVASKAARVVIASGGRPVHDIGARHGDPAAAPFAARAAYIAGCFATSCEEAGRSFGVPVAGTWNDSDALSPNPDDEIETLSRIAGASPGDDLDEHDLRALLRAGAAPEVIRVGAATALTPDAPSLGAAYALVEIEDRLGARVALGRPRSGASLRGGSKQVWRRRDANGVAVGDVLGRSEESVESPGTLAGEPLLVPMVRMGKLVRDLCDPHAATQAARERARRAIASLPERLREIDDTPSEPYPVTVSDALDAWAKR